MTLPARASRVPGPPVPLRPTVAVLVSRFPTVTETFILREIDELERQGQPVRLVPLLRDAPAVLHREVAPWMPRALFTPLLSPGIVVANLRALVRHPLRYGSVVARLVAGTLRRPTVLVRTLALLPKSVSLAAQLRAEGVGHVHAHFATYPATMALIIAALTDITFSVTAHAHDIFVDRSLLRLKLARARFVRVISDYNRAFLAARYPAETCRKLLVIHMGIPLPPAVARPRANGGRRGAAGAPRPRLLCVAALKPYKGVHVLVDACRHLHAAGVDVHCDIVGEGPERQRLARQIVHAGLGDMVRLVGARRQTEVAAALRQASVFVLPSMVAADGQMEGIPVALMEAMAAGLPVVATALSGIPELVEDGVSGLLAPPGDAVALAGALGRLLGDPALRRRLGAGGRRAVARDFTLEGTVAALLAELDRHTPAASPEVQRALGGPTPLGAAALGCRRLRATQDACVVELLAAGPGGPRECVVKIARTRPGESAPAGERARREYVALTYLARVFASPDPGGAARAAARRAPIRLGVPRPLALDESRAALWLERCSGQRLDQMIRAARFRHETTRWAALRAGVGGAGQWLQRFQACAPPLEDREPQRRDPPPPDPHAALHALVAQSVAALDESALPARARAQTHARLDTLATQVADQTPCVVARHGDFWPGNVFIDAGAVQVIDLEGIGLGLPCEDVGWFLVTLELLFAYPLLRRRAAPLAAVFLEGYGRGAGPLAPAALALGRLAAAAALLASLGPAGGVQALRWRRALRAILAEGQA